MESKPDPTKTSQNIKKVKILRLLPIQLLKAPPPMFPFEERGRTFCSTLRQLSHTSLCLTILKNARRHSVLEFLLP